MFYYTLAKLLNLPVSNGDDIYVASLQNLSQDIHSMG